MTDAVSEHLWLYRENHDLRPWGEDAYTLWCVVSDVRDMYDMESMHVTHPSCAAMLDGLLQLTDVMDMDGAAARKHFCLHDVDIGPMRHLKTYHRVKLLNALWALRMCFAKA